MKAIYQRFAKMTDKLLNEKFGDDATLASYTSVYNDVTDKTVKTRTSVTCTAAIGEREILGEGGITVAQTVATLNARPKIGDELTVGEAVYKVLSVKEVSPIGATSYRPDASIDGNFFFDDGSAQWVNTVGGTAPSGIAYEAFEGRTNIWSHDRYAQAYGKLIAVSTTGKYRLRASFFAGEAATNMKFGLAFYNAAGTFLTERYPLSNGNGYTGWNTLSIDVSGVGTGIANLATNAAFIRPLWVCGNSSTAAPRWGIDFFTFADITLREDIPAIVYKAVVEQ